MRGSGRDTVSGRRDWRRWVVVGVVVAVPIAVLLSTGHGHQIAVRSLRRPTPGARPEAGAPPSQPELVIPAKARLAVIPRSFLGLSTEYWTLPVDERHLALYRRVLSLLRVPGDGPLILRIGGDSSDHALYDPRVRKLPRWVFGLTPEFIARTARIVYEMRLRVILDLNLITATPELATAWAGVAEAAMPRGSIIGFEIGNEPDLYSRAFWLLATEGDRFAARVLPNDLTPERYARDFELYSRLLARTAPHVPLYAPALANPGADAAWIAALLSSPHPGLRVVSGHRYPYSACALPHSPLFPTIARILSEQASAGMASSVRPAVALARAAGLPFRLTEINSVTCGGVRGVSDAFATALWAPDAIFELARAGVQGVNLHERVYAVNDPFTFDRRGLLPRPLLYGLILFARTLGPDARLVSARLQKAPSLHLKAWTVEIAGGVLHVLLLNKGPRSLSVEIAAPSMGTATVERLLAPSPSATSGETLGGQRLDHDGRWVGAPVRETISARANRYVIGLPRYSAALVSIDALDGTARRATLQQLLHAMRGATPRSRPRWRP